MNVVFRTAAANWTPSPSGTGPPYFLMNIALVACSLSQTNKDGMSLNVNHLQKFRQGPG